MLSKILNNPWNQSLAPLIKEGARMQQAKEEKARIDKEVEKWTKDEIQRLEDILIEDKLNELTEEEHDELKKKKEKLFEELDYASFPYDEYRISNEIKKLEIRERYHDEYKANKAELERLQQWNKDGHDWTELLKKKTGYNKETLPFKKVRGYLGRGKKSKKKHQKKGTKKHKKKRPTKKHKKKRPTKKHKKKRH